MKSMPDKSVDAVITDPPYGTTAINWDKSIDLSLFWDSINPLIKQNTPVIVFSSQPSPRT
jgi:site-specific DNA-methyltransferase (adenine-specific)